ncbi:AP-4 complex accessory subunit RUSC1 isoform X5 [Manis pentadactyla]|uniref:AP-4 complex accessory subunit RUSC1 isoform X5 n=1 Tax=Manis pentadactyla TaxID=143292 RepID=UPI00255C680F|nr:AP-4 complex accessory subunit RUSC1 isoform X5 [Manis pentadactyla]
MLSPQRALLCNLNHIHLQHVSLGLHLSRRPELREGPLSTSPPPGDTGGKDSRRPCSGTLVDANSNSPAVPCRCCQEHGSGLENRQDPAQEEEGAASPSDPGCSSSLSSCSDLSPDESPISVYSRDLPGNEDVHPQPSIIPLEQGSPLASAGPGTCSPDSFCCSPDSCSGDSSTPGPGLDSNCNALTTCQDLPSPGLEEEEEGGEQSLPTSELPEADEEKTDAGKNEPSWKINPIWKIDTEKTEAAWKITENNNSGLKTNGNPNSSWESEPAKFDSGWKTNTGISDSGSKTDAGKTDGGWRSDVSEEPVPHRTITSFHELAQKRKRGPGLPLVQQAKKDRSDWLIVFSPDTELPPTGSLGGSPAPAREVTTFKDLRARIRAPPPPVPPREPPAGWALVPPRPPPPPVPPRRKKNRSGLQPIAEGQPEEGRAGSPAAGEEATATKEPEEPGTQASLEVRSSWSFAGVPGAQRLWMAEAQSGTGQLQEQKKGLLIAVSASVDKIISHFGAARNLVQKNQLGDSRLSPDVGHLVLTTLCPALHALVADGLKPFRKDLITGQRRSSPWSVVEASVKPGEGRECGTAALRPGRAGAWLTAPMSSGSSTRSLGTLYSQVSRLAPLSSSRSRFHAFILGLLNTKQLEQWFSSLQEDAGLLSLLYLPTGFFSLARGGCPSLSTELLLLLQPLSVLTFHLDLLFEAHHLPLGPPQAPAPAGSPPALQQTVQAVLHWGGRLAQSLRGASGETAPGASAPSSLPAPGSWWEQLTQASRVYASGGTEGFRSRHQGMAAEGAQERSLPTEAAPGRGLWLGRLFGVPGGLTETESGAPKSRRPSSWLPPTMSVLALVKRGTAPETPSPPEELEASAPSPAQTHRAASAFTELNQEIFCTVGRGSPGTARRPHLTSSQHLPLVPHRAVRALCDHAAAAPDQLSFRHGEVLRVIATVDEDWLRCGRGGVEGLVPVGYTSLVL